MLQKQKKGHSGGLHWGSGGKREKAGLVVEYPQSGAEQEGGKNLEIKKDIGDGRGKKKLEQGGKMSTVLVKKKAEGKTIITKRGSHRREGETNNRK